MKEGDTPSFTYALAMGLGNPSQPGWGGRFQLLTNQVYVGAQDALEGTGFGGANERYTVARWRPYYQNDFAARMDWCVQAYAGANHHPIAFANNDGSRAILSNSVAPGALVQLDARGSFDPDGDALSYTWFFYQDAGSATNGIVLSNASNAVASFVAPTNAGSQSLHCILAVTDDGSPLLTSFRRVLVHVNGATNEVGTNCLLGYWKLDEGTGTSTADATSNNVTGTLLNGPAWTGGRYGQALVFDGVNDRVGLGNPTHLRLTGAMTLAAWVWIESFAGNGRIVNKQGASGNRGWSLNVESGGYASFQVARDASTLVYVNSSSLPLRQWTHLAGTYEPGNALRIYINGLPDRAITTGVPSSQYNSGLDVVIGDRPVGGTPFNGRIDEVRIYSCVQNPSQIAALGPLRFSSATRSASHFSLSWTGLGQLEFAPVLPGPWSLIIPAPAPPYTEEIALDQSRFFRLRDER
jgi:hypothetical protein